MVRCLWHLFAGKNQNQEVFRHWVFIALDPLTWWCVSEVFSCLFSSLWGCCWGRWEQLSLVFGVLMPAPLGRSFQYQEPAGKDLTLVLSFFFFFSVANFDAEAWHLPLAFPDALWCVKLDVRGRSRSTEKPIWGQLNFLGWHLAAGCDCCLTAWLAWNRLVAQ